MKRPATTLALLALAAFIASPAFAVNLLSEGFNYANGNLVPNGGWANYSGAATDIQVVAGRAVGSGPNANDDHVLFAPQPTAGNTFACFIARIPPPASGGQPKPIYFAELKDGGTSNLVARVYVLPLSAGGWTFGISYSSTSATQGVTPWTVPLSYDTDYTLVISYEPSISTSRLWVNPITQASPSVSNVGTSAAISVSGFGLRQSATASTLPAVPAYVGTADWDFSVDNLGVGTTFDDACARPTPTLKTTWGGVKSIYR
jgi:hypothetical protein